MVVVSVRSYKRRSVKGKPHSVKRHSKRYPTPRGKVGRRRLIASAKTRWLKDRQGLFVGRASQSKPSPITLRPVKKSRWDNTTVISESNYGRQMGRA